MSLFRHASRRHQASHNPEVCDLQTHDSVTMEDFQCEVLRALWHPFDILDDGKTGKVQVSRLKVITSNIGLRLGHKKAEELLNKGDVASMTFEDFFTVIKDELLDKIDDEPTEDENSNTRLTEVKKATKPELLNGIIKTCWTFCSFERHYKVAGMTLEHCMVLWRLFNFLSECDEARIPIVPIRLHRDEVALLLQKFIDYTGQRNKESVIREFKESRPDDVMLTFTEFLNLFEKDIAESLSRSDITQGLNHMFDFYVMNVLAKEMLWKRGYNVKNWKERWLVLTTTDLKYYVNSSEKVLKGEITFDSECQVEVPPDRPTNRPHRFVIKTTKKPYEISAPDARTKNEWVSAIQTALKVVGENPNIQKEAAFQRNLERINKKRLLEDEERKRLDEAERQRKQQEELDEERKKRLEDEEMLRKRQEELEEERKRRAEMEGLLTEEQRRLEEERRLREEEQQRLRELEAIKQELERLLEEERQAKKDEEIVRNLQARLLEEEFQKREELEKLKQQQEELLKSEREQKAMLEGDKIKQERILREARERLEQLERERAAAAEKMQEASDKLLKAEKHRLIMEERVKLYKTKTSVGLRGTVQPRIEPLVTHRGQGAFCSKDFVKKESFDEDNPGIKQTNGTLPSVAETKSTEKADHVNDDILEENVKAYYNNTVSVEDVKSDTGASFNDTNDGLAESNEEGANDPDRQADDGSENGEREITDSGYHDEDKLKSMNSDNPVFRTNTDNSDQNDASVQDIITNNPTTLIPTGENQTVIVQPDETSTAPEHNSKEQGENSDNMSHRVDYENVHVFTTLDITNQPGANIVELANYVENRETEAHEQTDENGSKIAAINGGDVNLDQNRHEGMKVEGEIDSDVETIIGKEIKELEQEETENV